MPPTKLFLATGALFGMLAVIAGAFGSHALKNKFSAEQLSVFEVAVRYQMYHAFALMIVALMFEKFALMSVAGWLFAAGTTIFSGSLYMYVVTGVKLWGAVTPVGGVLLVAGWACMIIGALK